jgi:anthranilate phosphoribosyltransferase
VNQAEAEELFGRMLDGTMADKEIAATLVELADRGETAEELAGAARAMRARMKRIAAPANAMDVCGTGGDGQHSLNVSTAVAIVVAACGVPVAKHGNRAASSKAGAADTLEALGLDLAKASENAASTLADIGICFLFAQAHHPVLARVSPIRKTLGRRTIFNLLGPLANPAGVRRQLVGVPTPALMSTYHDALAMLDMDRAMVVSGEEGLDEISISGPSRVATIGINAVANRVAPEEAGLARYLAEALRGGDAAFNAAALRRLLQGEEGAYRDAVLLNAAGALIVADEVSDWRHGVEEAAEAIDKGLVNALLDCWIEAVK